MDFCFCVGGYENCVLCLQRREEQWRPQSMCVQANAHECQPSLDWSYGSASWSYTDDSRAEQRAVHGWRESIRVKCLSKDWYNLTRPTDRPARPPSTVTMKPPCVHSPKTQNKFRAPYTNHAPPCDCHALWLDSFPLLRCIYSDCTLFSTHAVVLAKANFSSSKESLKNLGLDRTRTQDFATPVQCSYHSTDLSRQLDCHLWVYF